MDDTSNGNYIKVWNLGIILLNRGCASHCSVYLPLSSDHCYLLITLYNYYVQTE